MFRHKASYCFDRMKILATDILSHLLFIEKIKLRQVTGFSSTLRASSMAICLGASQIHKKDKW